MANHKPPREDAEVQALAARWCGEWTQRDGIEPWLRRQLPELTRLIRNDRWSWGDLARALNAAGVRYATGRPWSAEGLSQKVRKIRWQQRRAAVELIPRDLPSMVHGASADKIRKADRRTFDVPDTVASCSECAVRPAARHATAVPLTIEETDPSQDDAEPMQEEPCFTFARLKGWSPSASERPAAEQQPSPAAGSNGRDVGRILQEFLSRSRRGSIPMPPILEPEDE